MVGLLLVVVFLFAWLAFLELPSQATDRIIDYATRVRNYIVQYTRSLSNTAPDDCEPRRPAVHAVWNTNAELSPNELLDAIVKGAAWSTSGGQASLSYMLAPFSALLVRLSRDSDKTADKMLKATRNLFWLTWALLILTFLLLLEEVAKDYLNNHQTQQANQNGMRNIGDGGVHP
jgi:hypothetical protein